MNIIKKIEKNKKKLNYFVKYINWKNNITKRK